MTPEEVVDKFLPPAYFQGGTYDNLRELTIQAIRAYGDERAAEMQTRCIEVARDLGWRSDASDAMRVATTTIIAAIRGLT